MADPIVDEYMNLAIDLVLEGGSLIRAGINQSGHSQVSYKSTGPSASGDGSATQSGDGHASSILTATDGAVEKLIVDGIRRQYPNHQFIGEEGTYVSAKEGSAPSMQVERLTSDPTWIIDPIDGTMNFVHRNPLVCTSVALAMERKVVGGIVYNPITDDLFTAIRGMGAWLRRRNVPSVSDGSDPYEKVKLQVSPVPDLSKAMVIVDLPAGSGEQRRRVTINNLTALLSSAHALRCPGPAALDIAWIGAGFADAFAHQRLHVWDMAAGAIIVTEAGGCVLNMDGTPFNMFCRSIATASSEALARQLISKIELMPMEPSEYDAVDTSHD